MNLENKKIFLAKEKENIHTLRDNGVFNSAQYKIMFIIFLFLYFQNHFPICHGRIGAKDVKPCKS